MAHLRPHVTITNLSEPPMEKKPVPIIVTEPKPLSLKLHDEVKTIPVPKKAPVFDYSANKERVKVEGGKKEEKKFLPGEKVLVQLDQTLKKQKKKQKDEDYVKTLSQSIENVLNLL